MNIEYRSMESLPPAIASSPASQARRGGLGHERAGRSVFIKLPEYIPSKFCGSLFFGSAVFNNSLTVWLEENMKKAASE
jgi:hypothetical protein